MDIQAKLLDAVKKHGKGLAVEIVEEVVFAALEEVVKDSSNPFDDVLYATLKEPIKKALLDQINKI